MIGVYDSGFGGLSVLKHLRNTLPQRSFHYFGDSLRAPYGGRGSHAILDFSEQAIAYLIDQGCRLIVVACHTVSCVALRHLQRKYANGTDVRILGVAIPAAEYAVQNSRRSILVLATERTVQSQTYNTEIQKIAERRVSTLAARLFAPLVEEGWEESELARHAARQTLADAGTPDCVLLGCTHYPHLKESIRACFDEDVPVLDPAPHIAERLADWLQRHPTFDACDPTPTLEVSCSGDPHAFARHGERFLGAPLGRIHTVIEHDGRWTVAHDPQPEVGQIVR